MTTVSPEERAQGRADLMSAAAELQRRGHCQGSYVDWDGRCCALGAVRMAVGYYSARSARPPTGARRRLDVAISLIGEARAGVMDGCHDIVAYNDAPGRTQGEVVALLRRAAGAP